MTLEFSACRIFDCPNGPFPLDGQDISRNSRDQILGVLNQAPKIYYTGGAKIVRITKDTVVKYGRDVNIWEANNMRYVAQNTTVRLPAVLDAWEDDGDKEYEEERPICYIVMKYVEGRCLHDIWPDLNEDSRRDIHQQLHDFIRQLQQLEMDSPGPIGGGVSQGAFFTDYGAGPFTSREDMEAWFNDRLLVCQEFGLVSWNQSTFKGQFKRLVMCHMDLHEQNLLIDSHGKIWLIDWAFAGMYPPYFETAAILKCGMKVYLQGLLDLLEYEQYSKETEQLEAIGFALTTGASCKPTRRLVSSSSLRPSQLPRLIMTQENITKHLKRPETS
jgi:serine/threonine protein kinase